MTAEELQRFCAGKSDSRTYFLEPWSRGERTYATNGHILVSVWRIQGVSENAHAPDVAKLFADAKTGKWMPVPKTAMPADIPCRWCHGTGREPEDRRVKCGSCNGQKTEPDYITRTTICHAVFANRYLALIQGWEIAPKNKSDKARIRCDDAEGLLMPMRT